MIQPNTLFGSQSFFTCNLLDRFNILSDLKGTQILPLLVSDGIIADEYVTGSHANPEILMVFSTAFKVINDLFNDMHTCRWMAILNLATDNRLRAGKNSILAH